MAFDGNGNFVRVYSWVQDATNGIDITASRFDTEDTGFATGLSLCVTRDGQGKMSTDFLPNTDNSLNLGSGAKRWKSINGLQIAPLSNYAGDIRNYGAVTGTDCATAVASAAAANSLVIFPAGTWPMAGTPSIPAGVILQALPGATFSGTGAGVLGFSIVTSVGNHTSDYAPVAPTSGGAGELASFNYFRNATGTTGSVNTVANALRIQTNVAAGVTNFEWGLLSVLNNSAAAGQNVAGYFQGNKTGNVGPTWGAVISVQEQTAINGPASGTVALEIDVLANGTDTAGGNRVGCDMVIEKYNAGGVGNSTTWGFRVSAGTVDSGASSVGYGFAISPGGFATVGFDTSHATIATASVQMSQGQGIIWDGFATQHELTTYDGTGWAVKNSGNIMFRANNNGTFQWGGASHANVFANTSAGTGAAAAVLTANKPGASTAISTWYQLTLDGTNYLFPLWLAA